MRLSQIPAAFFAAWIITDGQSPYTRVAIVAAAMTKLVGSTKPAAQDRKTTPQASSMEDLEASLEEAAKNMGMR